MSSFGQLVVCIATVLSAAGGALVLAGDTRPALLSAGRKLLHAAAAASAATLLILVFLLVSHDYRVAYVRDYADRTMSLGYLVMAIWGGQQGSLLLWAVLQSWFTSAVAGLSGEQSRPLLPVALGFLAMLQVFFFGLVLFQSNPFESLGTVAAHGIGLNPLLRNPYMAVHPPTLYLGFVGFSVPTAFAISALIEGRAHENWLAPLRPWTLFAWIFLSVGNLLGMVWAYQELGWGGYWGWDPVENASFMPWLTGTALVHTAMIMKVRKTFRLWSLILTALTFLLIIFGTFLTRSGIIASVHAFAGATTGPYLLNLIVIITLLFTCLMIWRRHYFISPESSSSILSAESVFFIANCVFVLAALFVWFATMAPLFSEIFTGDKVAVTPEFFNRWMVPIGLIILVLIALCTIVGWRTLPMKKFGRRALIPVIVGAIAALAAYALDTVAPNAVGLAAAFPIISVGLIACVTTGVLRELLKILIRPRKSTGHSTAGRRRLGGQLVHLAMAVLFVGFTGSAFTVEQSASLSTGKTMQVGDYTLQLLGLREDNNYERSALLADLDVRRSTDAIGVLSPARHVYHSHAGQPTSEVVIRTGLFEDLFLILGEGNPVQGWAVIRAVVNPMVVWIWVGGLILVIGTLITMIPAGWTGALSSMANQERRRFVKATSIVTTIIIIGGTATLIGDLATTTLAMTGLCLAGVLFLLAGALNGLAESTEEK
ncbi:MAG: heme lyase CcmF/NrfE family subunit [Deltaproteobacteria bacterium]|nr:heme lyase CcmF/NrfE family subunit [Deltaproteobacteria bacterium]